MFDLESSIRAWRERSEATGQLTAGEIDELEEHLRCEIEGLAEVGIHGEAAFRVAGERLGDPGALGAEFAKLHPLLAWRPAFHWMALGLFTIVVGVPVFFAVWREAVVALGCTLHLGPLSARLLGWVGTFAPIPFFAITFALARRRRDALLPLLGSPVARSALLVVAAMTGLVLTTMSYPTWFYRKLGGDMFPLVWGRFAATRWHAEPALRVARDGFDDALFPMAAVVIIGLGALATRFGRRAASSRNDAPVFWLAIGCWVGTLAVSAFLAVRAGVLASLAFLNLQGWDVRNVVLAVTLAYPALLFAVTCVTLRRGLPSPERVVGANRLGIAIALLSALAVIGIPAASRISAFAHAHARSGTLEGSFDAHWFATMLIAGAMPVLLGACMLRSRPTPVRA